eukprot:s2211_g2.t1
MVPVPSAPPARPPIKLPVGNAAVLPSSEASTPKDPLQLCLPTYRDTCLASLISSIFIFAGLMVLSVSEAGLPGLPKNRWFVLSFRVLAWIALYFLPLHCVSFSNLRGYCVYGNAPGNSSLVCWRTALGPAEAFEIAERTGFSRRRVFVATVLLPSLYFLLYVAFVTVYVGEEHEHLGFIFIYGVGHFVIIFVAEHLGPKNFPPPLNPRYSQKMGPATLGVAVMGFFAVTTAYSVAKRYFGPWLGTLTPAMLGAYEIGCLLILERTFVREFVQEKSVRRAYHHSNQGIVVSAQICMVHGMAEGARLMLILADISQSTSDSDLTFMVPIVSGAIWNVMSRGGAFDRLLATMTCGRRTPTWCSLLLQQAKYCMGYPRFMAIGAVVLARWCSRNPLIPEGRENMALAVLILFLCEVGEDLVSYSLERLNFRVLPKQRHITEDELQMMAAAQLRVSAICEPERDVSIVPNSTPAWTPSDPTKELQDQCWKLRAGFAFAYGEKNFETLPFWAHFAVVMVAQFHTVLFMILLGNGLNYILGFCHETYDGYGRSLLWWPVTQEDLCI